MPSRMVCCPSSSMRRLIKLYSTWLRKLPRAELTVDLATQTLSFPGGAVTFPIDPFNKSCLLNGVDELGYIMSFEKEIVQFEARLE